MASFLDGTRRVQKNGTVQGNTAAVGTARKFFSVHPGLIARIPMVRTKNRYFLVELIPFFDSCEVLGGKRSLAEEQSSSEANPARSLPALTPAALAAALHHSIESNYGLHGTATLSNFLSVKYCNSATQLFILRVPREQAARVWHCLTWLTAWPLSESSSAPPEGLKCTWTVHHLAGTIRSCQKAAISHARRLILKATHSDAMDCGPRPSKQDLEVFVKKVRVLDH